MDPRSRPEVKREIRSAGLVFFLIYFVQKLGNNLEGITKIVMRKFLKSDLKLDAGQAGTVQTLASAGWFVKAFYGLISDRVPIFGYRRKSWLVITNLAAGVAWLLLVMERGPTYGLMILAVTSVNIMIAFADVICDGLMVETSQRLEERYGVTTGTANRPLQSMQWMGAFLAIFISSIVGGVIAQFYTLRTAAALSSGALILLGLVVGFFVTEERVPFEWEKAKRGIAALFVIAFLIFYRFATAKEMGHVPWLAPWKPIFDTAMVFTVMVIFAGITRKFVIPLVFSVLWWGLPLYLDSTAPYQYFTNDHREFLAVFKADTGIVPALQRFAVSIGLTDAETLKQAGFIEAFFGSIVMAGYALGSLLGTLAFWRYFEKMPQAQIFRICIVGRALVFAMMFVETEWHSFGNPSGLMLLFAVGGVVDAWAVLSVLGFAVMRCPRENQASVYATFASCANIGIIVGAEFLGGKLYTAFAQVTEDAVTKVPVAAAPHVGMRALVLISAGMLVLLWLGVHFLERRGYLRKNE